MSQGMAVKQYLSTKKEVKSKKGYNAVHGGMFCIRQLNDFHLTSVHSTTLDITSTEHSLGDFTKYAKGVNVIASASLHDVHGHLGLVLLGCTGLYPVFIKLALTPKSFGSPDGALLRLSPQPAAMPFLKFVMLIAY